MYKGSYVALVTPMLEGGAVDYQALEALIDWHIVNNTHGIVILGTTGEAATITPPERVQIITKVVAQVDGKIPVVVGTGTNATATTLELTLQAQQLGADAALVVTPYYNKPTQEGLFQHFGCIADATSLPIFLYNVPSRTGVDLLPSTVGRLAFYDNIVALKDATGDCERVPALAATGLALFSGDDATALHFIQAGGHGVISVAANVRPMQVSAMIQAALEGEITAQAMNHSLEILYETLFVETNPIPVKWLLAELGRIERGIRLPLTPLSTTNQAVLSPLVPKMDLVL